MTSTSNQFCDKPRDKQFCASCEQDIEDMMKEIRKKDSRTIAKEIELLKEPRYGTLDGTTGIFKVQTRTEFFDSFTADLAAAIAGLEAGR